MHKVVIALRYLKGVEVGSDEGVKAACPNDVEDGL